ncbi:MAG: heparan-alpha-glucosaminide N-acetyltransferase [Dehalococcoidia bacterium]
MTWRLKSRQAKRVRITPATWGTMDTTDAGMKRRGRLWEIDHARTIAIVMMITFHALYVPEYLGIADTMTVVRYGFWWWFPRVTAAGPFIFLAGLSLPISQTRSKTVSSFVLRGVKIFGLGMVITLLTWLVSPQGYVRFGILHFFGIAFMVGHLFLRFRYINLILGLALVGIGVYLDTLSFDFAWLLWLGLKPRGMAMMDYVPLLPWFGFFLLGIFCSKMLYPAGQRRFNIPDFSDPVTSALTLPGRYPLQIYVAQWPAILLTLLILYPDKLLPYLPF